MFPPQLQASNPNDMFKPINDLFDLLRELSAELGRQITEVLPEALGNLF